MLKRGVLLCLILYFSTGCASVRYSLPGPRTIPADAFGMAHAGGRLTPKENRLLDEMGVSWVRNTFRWDYVQKRTKQWDFRVWDAYVENAEGAGKNVLAVLAYDVPWIYGKEQKTPRRHIEPEKIPYFLQYVEAMVRRYKGRIRAYEIWNEPNWLFWKGPNEDFFALSAATAKRVKEVDPSAYLVVGSFWRVPEGFIRGMFRAGAFQYADAVSFHPYDFNPEGTLRLFDRFKRILDEEGFKGDIWVTEVGHPTGGWYLTRVSETRKPSYVVKTLGGLLVRGARVVFWYELFDDYPKGKAPSRMDSEMFFGLNYPDFKPKTGAAAYTLMAKHVAGAVYSPSLAQLSSSLRDSVEALPFLREDGTAVLILWSRTGERLPVRLTPADRFIAYDIATGKRSRVPKDGVWDLSEEPLFLVYEGEPSARPGRETTALAPADETGAFPKVKGPLFSIEEYSSGSPESLTGTVEFSFSWKIH